MGTRCRELQPPHTPLPRALSRRSSLTHAHVLLAHFRIHGPAVDVCVFFPTHMFYLENKIGQHEFVFFNDWGSNETVKFEIFAYNYRCRDPLSE